MMTVGLIHFIYFTHVGFSFFLPTQNELRFRTLKVRLRRS